VLRSSRGRRSTATTGSGSSVVDVVPFEDDDELVRMLKVEAA
jgi:hypothetical protein